MKLQAILLTLTLFRPIASGGVKCVAVKAEKWDIGEMKICYMQKNTSVTLTDTKIDQPKDETMGGIDFDNNKKINFLPIEIHKVFPNLRVLSASYCSLRTISKGNFEKLGKLERLVLSYNQIEKISIDAFEDLRSLKLLYLGDNKIKFLNGQAFDGLISLEYVDLQDNVCIEKDFDGPEAIATLKSKFDEKCGFHDHEATWRKLLELQATTAKFLDQMREINQERNKFSKKNEELESKISELAQENSKLRTENLALKREKAECESKDVEAKKKAENT